MFQTYNLQNLLNNKMALIKSEKDKANSLLNDLVEADKNNNYNKFYQQYMEQRNSINSIQNDISSLSLSLKNGKEVNAETKDDKPKDGDWRIDKDEYGPYIEIYINGNWKHIYLDDPKYPLIDSGSTRA